MFRTINVKKCFLVRQPWLAVLLFFPLFIQPMASQERETIVSVERIWDRAAHNAFTSLIKFKGKLYCAFRESNGHISKINGSIRVIASDDGQNWRSVAFLSQKDVDLRDPQLSVSPDGRIMLNAGGSYYEDNTLIRMIPKVSFSDQNGSNFSKLEDIVLNDTLATGKDWLWKPIWHKKISYSGIYRSVHNKKHVVLGVSTDGLQYNYLAGFNIPGNATETALQFDNENRMIAIVRRDEDKHSLNGYIGVSSPPYTDWDWSELEAPLGGPDLILLPNNVILMAGRHYLQDGTTKTVLSRATLSGAYKPLVTLPSLGDCSYPSMLIDDNYLYVSYYSSHEGKAAIYLTRLWLDRIEGISKY